MNTHRSDSHELSPKTRAFYRDVLSVLDESGIRFLVCGSHALKEYTGVTWHTKDLDVFVERADFERTLDVLARAGYQTGVEFAHWLGKVSDGEDVIDVIFNSGNGLCEVDKTWFEQAIPVEMLGLQVKLCPPEEIIWQKSFIMERERYDGADVAHLLRACGNKLDWPRLVNRFGPHWRVLLSHLILYGFIYPGHRSDIPTAVMNHLLHCLHAEMALKPDGDKICLGTLLSRAQYLPDIENWGYFDARLPPDGNLSRQELREWTQAIDQPPTDSTEAENTVQ
jgi:hypothetical protein